MKQLTVLILFIGAIGGAYSCKKLDKLTQFYLEYNTAVTVPPNTAINLPLDILTPDITTNYEDDFSANNTHKDKVDEIKVDRMRITVKAPQGHTLDFLKSINVYISAEGLPEKEVAWKTTIPDGLTSLDLEHTGDNLKDYVLKDKIKFRVKTVTDKVTNQSVDLEVNNRFWVNAKILGA